MPGDESNDAPFAGRFRAKRRKLLIILITSAALGLVWTVGVPTLPLHDAIVRVGYSQTDAIDPTLRSEAPEIKAILLSYLHQNKVLFLKAESALLHRPDAARELLSEYGRNPLFQDIMLKYGDSVLAPINYFRNHRILTLLPRHYARKVYSYFFGSSDDTESGKDSGYELTPDKRGRYAIGFIDSEGHRLLSQFVTDSDGNVHWVQTSRVLEDLSSFLFGGLRNLEAKWKDGDDVGAMDAIWATVDILPFLAAGKLMKLGKAASSGARDVKLVSKDAKVAMAGSKSVAREGKHIRMSSRLAKGAKSTWQFMKEHPGVVLGIGVIGVLRHPSLYNALLATVATVFGLPVFLIQLIGWLLPMVLILYVVTWLLRFVVKPVLFLCLQFVTVGVDCIDGGGSLIAKMKSHRQHARPAASS